MGIELEHSLGEGTLTKRQYNAIIGGSLLWGFLMNYFICKFCTEFFLSINPVMLLILYFVFAVAGILIAKSSFSAIVSFIGYNLVVLPIGAVISVCLVDYKPDLVLNAVLATSLVCLVMLLLATINPMFFDGLGSTLFISLTGSIVVELILMLLGVHLGITDWVVLIIFCGYIGYDWNRANNYAPTADNAVDCALELYLDIINIFLRILSIMSRSKSRD